MKRLAPNPEYSPAFNDVVADAMLAQDTFPSWVSFLVGFEVALHVAEMDPRLGASLRDEILAALREQDPGWENNAHLLAIDVITAARGGSARA